MAIALPLSPIARRPAQQVEQAPASLDYITELLVSRYCPDYLPLLLPMLNYQSRVSGNRWITWISATRPDPELFTQFGLNNSCVRFVYTSSKHDLYQLTHQALQAGNSHCVVAIQEAANATNKFNPEQLAALNAAAKLGGSLGLFVTSRDEF
ncbi:hypothetical protein [Halioxenophilus sp. WMMB6]|uniref:hypothetical protein n=1 Tax=Halioxenophilus sp. WMMB6 TaxID=3073815 RepID=UPI00295E601D|nr:hypothetical protein [Halioxenophilus sp. WMMB6]